MLQIFDSSKLGAAFFVVASFLITLTKQPLIDFKRQSGRFKNIYFNEDLDPSSGRSY
jgi:hypothetical protein